MVSNTLNPEKKSKLEEDISTNSENNLEPTSEFKTEFVGFRPEIIDKPNDSEKSKEIIFEEDNTEIEKQLDTRIQTLKIKLKKSQKKNIQIPLIKDEVTMRIEKVMEAGLEDSFRAMTPLQQQEFKIKGEETAWKIKQSLQKKKIKIREIFRLLLNWLKFLPGINRFFLEQEAKIKADKIVSIKGITETK
ncbi:MAG: hypothetical protein WC070_00870 [Candidatus Magasanikbacteria bacterium]